MRRRHRSGRYVPHFRGPSAIDKMVRSPGKTNPSRPAAADPPGLVERCGCRPRRRRRRGSAGGPCPSARRVSIFSAPLISVPPRASRPSRSSAAWRSAASIRSPRSAGTSTSLVLKRAASAPLSLPLALASSSAARPTPIQAPRPGARARTSGATWPSGDEREPDQLVARRRAPGEDAGPLGNVRSSSGRCRSLRLIPRIPHRRPPRISALGARPRTSGRGRP